SITKTVNNSTPNIGDNVIFTLTVTNNGPSDATGVNVTDNLPTGYTYVSDDGAGAYTGGVWTIGNLSNGATTTLNITATVNVTGSYANTATVTSDQNDPDGTDDSDTNTPTPNAVTELSIEKTVDDSTPDVGDNVVFTLTVTNDGPSDATGVTVTDNLPTGYTYVSDDGAGAYSGGVWTIGDMSNGAIATLNITATINATGDYANTASVTGDQNDPDGTDDSDTNTPTPTAITNLSIVKSVDNSTPDVGDNVVFTLAVTNNGPSAATGVSVTDNLPSGYTYVSDDGGGAYSGGIWTIGNLANGATATLNITVTVNPSGNFTNTAMVTGNETDPDGTDDSDSNTPDPNSVPDPKDDDVSVIENSSDNVINVLQDNGNGADNYGIDGPNSGAITITSAPANGNATVNDNGTPANPLDDYITYTPNVDYSGSDNIIYEICDADGECATATVNITVVRLNNVPIAVDDEETIDEDNTLFSNVYDNDTNLDDAPIVFVVLENVVNGTLTFNTDGTYAYTPDVNFNGLDSLTYSVCDGNGDCSSAKVIITINPVNDPPVANPDYETVDMNSSQITIDVSENDTDVDGNLDKRTVELLSTSINGSIISTDGLGGIRYTPAESFYGIDTIPYLISDSLGLSDTDTLFVTVNAAITVPNTFTPNGDGINDVLIIPGIEDYDNEIFIYNRWGNEVYHIVNYNNDINAWDGRAQNRVKFGGNQVLPVGTYFYILKFKGSDKPIKGYVYLQY
ncbi:MAG: DUF11 domain-containing protein, partial [Chloroflexia bacterium]|nr:DUF11 domain-containing protein [Chloroflexia bacterium]